MKVFLMTVTYLILPPALLLQNDVQKPVLTCTECWEAVKLIPHVVMTNWKKQLDEFSSSFVWLLQRNRISETWQAETKKLLPLAVDLWSGSDWCCVAANSSRWRNISSELVYLQIWVMKQKNNLCTYLTLQLCYTAFPWAQACVCSLHRFLEKNSTVCVCKSANGDISSSVWRSVTPAYQESVHERKETNWSPWETAVKYRPVRNLHIVRVLKKSKCPTVLCGLRPWGKISHEGCCKFLVQLVGRRKILRKFVS